MIVDAWIGLESLLFRGGSSGEIIYRASLREAEEAARALALLPQRPLSVDRDESWAQTRRLRTQIKELEDEPDRVLGTLG